MRTVIPMGGDLPDLRVWKHSLELVREVTALLRLVRGMGARFAADQMLRAAESIPANIAEGYGRGRGNDFARFLRVARGSATELESHLRVAAASGRLSSEQVAPVIARVRCIRAMLRGLADSVAARGRR